MAVNKAKGTYDVLPSESFKWQALEHKIREITAQFNYLEIRTPIFEYSEVFHRQNELSDMVTKETYNFKDKGDRNLTLRPEGTAGVIRSFVENKLYVNDPLSKMYYIGPNFRYERPQKGRFRQFVQFGVEAVGSNDPMLDAEVIELAYHFIQSLGLKGVSVRINTLGDQASRKMFQDALKAHFEPVKSELCADCQNRIDKNPLRILDCKVDYRHEKVVNAPTPVMYLTEASKNYFDAVKRYLDQNDVKYVLADRLVRGLDYYEHTVFEIEAEIEGFGAQNVLGGGGRYQNLVKELGGPDLPGIGFAFGMERLLDALTQENIVFYEEQRLDVFGIAIDETHRSYLSQTLSLLRKEGYRATMDFNGKNFKTQLKNGLKTNARYLIIIGEDEYATNSVSLKDTTTQEQVKLSKDELINYLKEMRR
ncbi:MAG: histidine--tRNA ligase [Paracholeplasma sp.]|nr:histidine--tRNA ligase [Paracholeplasma sp.]MDY3195444.1 histidine--tRNA ligase [Paracholeplasma sp.]